MNRPTRNALLRALLFCGCTALWRYGAGGFHLLGFLGSLISGPWVALTSLYTAVKAIAAVDWSWQRLRPTLIGLTALALVLIVPVNDIVESLKSPQKLVGECDQHTMDSHWIVLRQDRSVDYCDSGIANEVVHGIYAVSGDTIQLSFEQDSLFGLGCRQFIVAGELLRPAGCSTAFNCSYHISLNTLTGR